ncbi:MAG: hypothetical protein B7Z02_06865 [Rhodobacterales bacterium 32-67-9]|nr:MAG: hypothetical protein B7Z02_06865 [Rhodobacterales bacterium 32-67-9]
MADVPYPWTAEGWLYVAAVIDLFSARVAGWAMKAGMAAQLVTDALIMAIVLHAALPSRCVWLLHTGHVLPSVRSAAPPRTPSPGMWSAAGCATGAMPLPRGHVATLGRWVRRWHKQRHAVWPTARPIGNRRT